MTTGKNLANPLRSFLLGADGWPLDVGPNPPFPHTKTTRPRRGPSSIAERVLRICTATCTNTHNPRINELFAELVARVLYFSVCALCRTKPDEPISSEEVLKSPVEEGGPVLPDIPGMVQGFLVGGDVWWSLREHLVDGLPLPVSLHLRVVALSGSAPGGHVAPVRVLQTVDGHAFGPPRVAALQPPPRRLAHIGWSFQCGTTSRAMEGSSRDHHFVSRVDPNKDGVGCRVSLDDGSVLEYPVVLLAMAAFIKQLGFLDVLNNDGIRRLLHQTQHAKSNDIEAKYDSDLNATQVLHRWNYRFSRGLRGRCGSLRSMQAYIVPVAREGQQWCSPGEVLPMLPAKPWHEVAQHSVGVTLRPPCTSTDETSEAF